LQVAHFSDLYQAIDTKLKVKGHSLVALTTSSIQGIVTFERYCNLETETLSNSETVEVKLRAVL